MHESDIDVGMGTTADREQHGQLPEITTSGNAGTAIALVLSMGPTHTVTDSLEALSQELGEVEWFGRATVSRHPLPTPSSIDIALVIVGALLGAALYLLARL